MYRRPTPLTILGLILGLSVLVFVVLLCIAFAVSAS